MNTPIQTNHEPLKQSFADVGKAYEYAMELVRQGADPNQSLTKLVNIDPASLIADSSMLNVTVRLHEHLVDTSMPLPEINALLVTRVAELLSLGASLRPRPNQYIQLMCLAISTVKDRPTLLTVLDLFHQAGLRCDPQALAQHTKDLLLAARYPQDKTFKMRSSWINPIVACVQDNDVDDAEGLIAILQQRYGACLKDAHDNSDYDDVSPAQKAILARLLAQQERAWITAALPSNQPPPPSKKM